ncbi:glutathione S-transferase family protein [Pelagibacterium limicola]|uniref:glutathione S-transferase family protein n=1 Tax=Pelagibacterium limicola TaxID=2791022 RepID=UPI0018B00256|nr:glutathione S-transferase N-terminal domain-containing protein [Pelagibacterium limicola]
MLRVLGRLSSINVRKVVWMCAELRLDHEREDWGVGFRDPQSPDFLALNPNALVPVIEDQGFVLWESSAIVRYLARKHGGGRLLGGALEDQALIDQWLGWQATELNSSWSYAVQALIRKKTGYDSPADIENSIAGWTEKMAILDAQLERTGAYVAGTAFSAADIAMGLSVQRWYAAPFHKRDFGNVAGYFERLKRETEISRHGLLDYP